MMASIFVSNIPPECRRTDLVDHFNQRWHGGKVAYVLHPLGLKQTKAVVAFEDTSALESAVTKDHSIFGQKLKVSAIPRQVYTSVRATLDPIVLSGISNWSRYLKTLEHEYSVKVRCSELGHWYIEGTLLQIQCVQQQLEVKHQEYLQMQQQEMTKLSQPDSLLPRHETAGTQLPSMSSDHQSRRGDPMSNHLEVQGSLHKSTSSPLRMPAAEDPLLSSSDKYRSMPALHMQSRSDLIRQQQADESLRGSGDIGIPRAAERSRSEFSHTTRDVTQNSNFQDNEDKVSAIFAGSMSAREASRRDRYANSGSFGQTDAYYQSMPVGRQPGHEYSVAEQDWRNRRSVYDDMLNYDPRGATTHISDHQSDLDPRYAGRDPRTSQTGGENIRPHEEQEMNGLVQDLNADVIDFMYRMEELKLVTIQSKYSVEFIVEEAGSHKQLLVIANQDQNDSATSSDDVRQAQKEFLRLYQRVKGGLVKQNIIYDKENLTEADVKRIMEPVLAAYGRSLLFDIKQAGEVRVIGDKMSVKTAADWAQDKLKYHRKTKSFLKESDLSDRSQDKYRTRSSENRSTFDRDPEEMERQPEKGRDRAAVVGQDARGNSSVQQGSEPAYDRFAMSSRGDEDPAGFGAAAVRRDAQEKQGIEPAYDMFAMSSRGDKDPTGFGAAAVGRDAREKQGSEPAYDESAMSSRGDKGPTSLYREGGAWQPKPGTSNEYDERQNEFNGFSFKIGSDPWVRVEVCTGDLTKLEVDAIVNPANPDLHLIGGVSFDIMRAAQDNLQEECTKYVSLHGQLKVTDVASTVAGGKLKCKHIIHVVGPFWMKDMDNNEDRCRDQIRDSVLNCLNLANGKLRLRSIGLPAISTGVFGVPEEICAQGMFEALRLFSAESSNVRFLQNIFIIHLHSESTELFSVIFKQLLSSVEEGGYQSDVSSEGLPATHVPPGGMSRGLDYDRAMGDDRRGKSTSGSSRKKSDKKETEESRASSHAGKSKDSTKVTRTNLDRDRTKPVKATAANPKTTSHTSSKSHQHSSTAQQIAKSSRTSTASSKPTRNSSRGSGTADDKKPPGYYREPTRSSASSRQFQSLDPSMLHGLSTSGSRSYTAESRSTRNIPGTKNSRQTAADLQLSEEDMDDTDSPGARGHTAPHGPPDDDDEVDKCAICLEVMRHPKKLEKCGHIFCRGCIDEYAGKHGQKKCPTCGMVYGKLRGDQPKGGSIRADTQRNLRLPGHEDVPTYVITFTFPSGKQGPDHPNPGTYYRGTTRVAYLPANETGRKVLKLIKTAFEAGLMFTIGQSRTTGHEGVITYNDIHMKTSIDGGPTRFGYPDPTYLDRVREELAAKGIVE